MLKFSANLSMLFAEHDFIGRFAAAARAGFKGVEYVGPYSFPKEQLAEALRANRLAQVLFNLPVGNWSAGERGIACLPGRVNEFQAGVATAIDYARVLDCKMVNCLAGLLPPGLPRETAFATMASNLAFAARELSAAGIQLVVEPINRFDMPGFLLNTSADGISMLNAVPGSPLKLQYDIYHMQRMEGELAATMQAHLPRIAHIQLADNPGRNEPGTGEINYAFLFAFLDRIGYTGWIGCEYKPAAATQAGLGWRQQLIK